LRHNYLVILGKVIVQTLIIGREEFTVALGSELQQVTLGLPLADAGVRIVDPDDYFSWMIVGNEDDLRRLMREIYYTLLRYDLRSVDEDVFRLLYEQVVDKDTRHRLGEFFTPKWLARFLIEKAVTDPDHRVLDPACGSGTFLVETIKHKGRLLQEMRGKISTDDLDRFIDDVYGFDINPMAVFLARANIYLVLSRLAEDNGIGLPQEIKPRVYVADSLSWERALHHRTITGAKGIFVTMASQVIPVPENLSSPEEALETGAGFGFAVSTYVEAIEEGSSHDKALRVALAEAAPSMRETFRQVLETLKAELSAGDHIWGFVYRNKLIPIVSGRFDAVVGNPPWLVYRDMDPKFQEFADFVADRNEIRPHPKVKTSFDLAVVFTLACRQYLDRESTLAFVLPESVLTGLQHLPFLRKVTEESTGLWLEEAHDLRDVNPPPFPHGIACIASVFRNQGGEND
ncbi:MAG: N-6 DNA methylase, partial [Candidatus Geothermarchaeales archaeon]